MYGRWSRTAFTFQKKLVRGKSTEAGDRAERKNYNSCKRIQHTLCILTAVSHTNELLKAVMQRMDD